MPGPVRCPIARTAGNLKDDCLFGSSGSSRSCDQRTYQSLGSLAAKLRQKRWNIIASEDGVFPGYVHWGDADARLWSFVTVT